MSSKLLTVKEMAERLGYCEKTIRRKLKEGLLPGAFRIGGKGARWRIATDSLERIKGQG